MTYIQLTLDSNLYPNFKEGYRRICIDPPPPFAAYCNYGQHWPFDPLLGFCVCGKVFNINIDTRENNVISSFDSSQSINLKEFKIKHRTC